MVRPSKPNGYVNFRWAPSYDCSVIMRCYAWYALTVIAQDGSWAQVSDPQTGYVGFMNRSFLTTVGDGTSAVSYTHLDVYKRQVYNHCKFILLNR